MKWISLWILPIVFLSVAHAEPLPGLTLPEVLQHMQDTQRTLQTVHFHFSETVGKASVSDTILGEISFKRPYHLRVDQAHPEKQTLWSDGDHFWLYSPAEGQELTGSWTLWLSRSGFPAPLMSFMTNASPESWTSRYNVLFGGYDDHLYKVLFKPKAAGDFPMQLWISDSTFLPVRGLLQAPNAPVDVLFKNIEINPVLSDRLFTSTIPEGTPVVPLPS